ncbi:MAG: CvpA family protein [Clostridia bacterium]|nr:CvpA family protein [Clostridia bacterium]
MNLTFLDQALWWDVIFASILLFCIWATARRGALRAVSGLAGTVLGLVLGNHFQDSMTVFIEPALRPVMESLAKKADLTNVTGLEEGSLLSDLVAQSQQFTEKAGRLYEQFVASLGETLTDSLAPIISFLIIFVLTKIALHLICGLLDLDIPVISGLNRVAGGILGAFAGAAVVLVLCWAVIRFAPTENVGLLSLPCLRQSHLGQLLVPLIFGAPL